MALWILRGVFLLVASGVSLTAIRSPAFEQWSAGFAFLAFLGCIAAAVVLVALDVLIRPKRIELVSCVYFGVIVGLFLSYLVGQAVGPLLLQENMQPSLYTPVIQMLLSVAICYICISLLMQTKDDFRFVIPYVEFTKEVKGIKPYVLDTSVIIDGRIADVVETNILDSQLIMPRFVLSELQAIADSNDRLRRSRGRRGLDILNRLRSNERVDMKIYDHEFPNMAGHPVDIKLVLLAKQLEGKIVTGDYNLNKVARLHNVPVVNLNDIANALKPVFLPGEQVDVMVVKAGEEPGQGVGYLDDGTMIVIEGGRDHQQTTVRIVVTSVLQTSAGRMIFGRFDSVVRPQKSGERSTQTQPS